MAGRRGRRKRRFVETVTFMRYRGSGFYGNRPDVCIMRVNGRSEIIKVEKIRK